MIAAEVFFDFDPLFGVGLAPRVIHRFAFYKPRLGELTDAGLPGRLTGQPSSPSSATIRRSSASSSSLRSPTIASSRRVVLGGALARGARAGASPSAVSRRRVAAAVAGHRLAADEPLALEVPQDRRDRRLVAAARPAERHRA